MLKYRTSEKDAWEDDPYDILSIYRLAEFLAEQEYEGEAICNWEYRVQTRTPDGKETWLTVRADLEFNCYEDD